MSMEDYDYLFKIVLIGNAGVGKTCLVRRFTQGLFPPGQGATIGVDFMIKTVEIKGQKVKLQIWDTAGQERFRSITQSYYRSANALILTYDITCEDSFRCLPEWLREIEQYANSQVVSVLVGEWPLVRRRYVSDSQVYRQMTNDNTLGVGQVTRSTCRRSVRWLGSVPRTLLRRSACCTWRPPPRSRTTWRSSSWTWPPSSSARPSTTSWTTTRRPPRPARARPSAT
ncbi:ras-related protein Rab-30-like isoform X1 [Hippocampus comes]|uniref:ras-related protein Rab-30-like isoform X1 n=1 Tax=Hippocampus comes TaxID=109280 RepID=UPI00094EEA19|nr:PREDICTED: ras-related protein Rab-30-like isoform X1 [Hippocampus comes]